MLDVRKDFPILETQENGKRLVYLDTAATAQKPLPVLNAVRDYYLSDNANPNRGVYELDARATEDHEKARVKVASFLGCLPEELIFTQNTTEGLNLIAYSYAMENLHDGDEIVVSVSEHHSNLVPWQRVADKTNARLVYLYPDQEGHFTQDEVQKIGFKTKLVAFAEVSNVLGCRLPVEELTARAHSVGAVVILDIAQAVPHMPVHLKTLDVDFAAFSGHKLYAPMGIGGLYIRKEILDRMVPFLSGGDMINQVHESGATWAEGPRKFEAGTRNVGGEVGLSAAVNYLQALPLVEAFAHEQTLMRRLVEGLKDIPHVQIYGPAHADDHFGVVSFNIEDVHPHDTATILDADGIAVRAGHHCAQPLMEYLHIASCCRASLGIYTSEEDIDAFLASVRTVRRWMGYGAE